MNRPQVSIITPTFNHEAFIGECIESVLTQTFPDWELLIVDDGSTDRTWEIISRYASDDDRIRAVRQANRGIWHLADTYNAALRRARGELVAMVEGDDYWPPEKLANQVDWYRQYPDLLLAYGRVGIVTEGEPAKLYLRPPLTGVHPSHAYLREALLRRSALMSIGIVVRREALDTVGGFQQYEGYPAVDFPTWLAVTSLPGRILFVDQVVGFWRHHGTQVTQALGVEMAESGLRVAKRALRELDAQQASELGVTEADIERASKHMLAEAYFGRLRAALIQRDRDTARQMLPLVWRNGNLKRRAEAAYARVALEVGCDMELPLRLYAGLVRREQP